MVAEIWAFQVTVSALACAAIFSNRDRNALGFIGILVATLLFRRRPTSSLS